MTIEVQLISFSAFFSYGIFLAVIYELVLKNRPAFTYIAFIVSSFIFMYILFLINGGRVHPYFIATFILGLLSSKVSVKFIKKRLHILKLKIKK